VLNTSTQQVLYLTATKQ